MFPILNLDSREELLRKIFTFDYCSVAESCPTLCDLMDCSMLGFPVLDYLLELCRLMSIESVMPSNHLILCRPQSFTASGTFPVCYIKMIFQKINTWAFHQEHNCLFSTFTFWGCNSLSWESYGFKGCISLKGIPGGSDHKRICLQCGRPGLSPWVGKIPCRREGMATHSSILVWRIP